MKRYRLLVEYDGTPYKGWQRQDDVPTVQGAIEEALVKLGERDRRVQGSGRTDAGVHATGQVAHVDLEKGWKPFRLAEALNAHLRQSGNPIAITACEETEDAFHARFSAMKRSYIYRISNRRAPLTLARMRAWHVSVPLNIDWMNEAAQCLVGEHDFTTFRSTECQAKSPVKTLDRLQVSTSRDGLYEFIEIHTEARSFLHNQVRSMAGALKLVGEGKWNADDLKTSLEARARTACAPVAPACGLYLQSVSY